ncbi:uncharacterized protein Smp_201590 [Schistosoma mansoni]|uniref:uncharacterized protein n=1 Tax=Schistosoma mansoni TaxID=6183 RepID=UPI00022DC6C9|nr:uncharacterized protein Smp_201590 [Schistosoma mansoni]|eukprot:XP_018650330.1 uncharacterized protein Smp_201590 [Schistosoma mansoni]
MIIFISRKVLQPKIVCLNRIEAYNYCNLSGVIHSLFSQFCILHCSCTAKNRIFTFESH